MSIKPYTAVGLIPTVRGIRHRSDIKHNLTHIKHLTKAASWLSSLDIPVRLIAVPEGALQGFNDEVLDAEHEDFAKTCCIDIPGWETDMLGGIAREYNSYIIALLLRAAPFSFICGLHILMFMKGIG